MADDDLEALVDSGPGGGSAAATTPQRFIGVPDKYAAPRETGTAGSASHFRSAESGDTTRLYTPGGGTVGITPRYVTGSEYRMRSLSPERIAQLQRTLADAGLIGPKQVFRVGVWDETSAAAYRKVLAYANQGGIDEDTALSELKYHADTGQGTLMRGDGTAVGDGSTIKQGRIQTVTPAVTLEEQAQQVAKAELGRRLKASEVSKFVSIYNGIEKHYNSQERAAADAADLGTDTTLTAPPTADVAASQFIDHNYATERAGQDSLGYLGALEQLVGGR